MARISIFGPSCATAVKIAVRSAQLVMPYDAFSTLQPRKILSVVVSSAAPTLNFEYGACAFFMARFAAALSRARIVRWESCLAIGPFGFRTATRISARQRIQQIA